MREATLIALKALIETISTGNGYTLNVNHVDRQWKQIDDLSANQLPAVLILDDGPEEIDENSDDSADVTFQVSLVAYVEDHESPSTALNEIDVAIKKAIASDETLNGTIMLMTVLPYKTRDFSTLPPYAWLDRPVQITYEGSFAAGL